MSFKKRINGSWVDTPNYIHNTFTDTITTLPADIYTNDTTATVGLKGNTLQSWTPTPTAPAIPVGTGERTGNLLPFTDKLFSVNVGNSNLTVECKNGNLFFQGNAGEIGSGQAVWKNNFAFELEAGTYYCNSPVPLGQGFGRYIKKYDDNTTILTSTNYTFTLSEKTKCFLSFYIYQKTLDSQVEVMLNSGSSALPYEPYGYKIPISSANTTTPVYLGEVETMRRIKKLVLTGEENWYVEGSDIFYSDPITEAIQYPPICSHFIGVQALSGNNQVAISQSLRINIKTNSITHTTSDFKAYLQQQYAAGIPVCVWYVLATPETAVVNESLRKIGDYADEVSGITIPTIAGGDTIDVNTTLEPSEVSINYKGWHPITDVHRFNGTSWN